jgi:hypothetical protein
MGNSGSCFKIRMDGRGALNQGAGMKVTRLDDMMTK